VSLRRASSDDATLLATIQEEASKAGVPHVYPPTLYPFPRGAVQERWRAYTAAGGWAMLTDEGFVAVDGEWLEAMYVLPAAWGRGLADQLHAAALDQLRAHGAMRGRLWVLELNGRARRFYERHGWQPDGTSREVEFPPHPTDLGYALDLGSTDHRS
jgi:GNAT superfamily N-acetyltransferase